jgi:hypothetical protein
MAGISGAVNECLLLLRKRVALAEGCVLRCRLYSYRELRAAEQFTPRRRPQTHATHLVTLQKPRKFTGSSVWSLLKFDGDGAG